MNNYMSIAQAAFNSHPILSTLYCIPAVLVFLLCALLIVGSLNSRTSGPNAGFAEAIFMITAVILAFLLYFIFPEFKYINLQPRYASALAKQIYTKELNNIKNKNDSAFYELSQDNTNMANFKQKLLSSVPQGVNLYNKDIMKGLQPFYIKCMEIKKLEYIKDIHNEISLSDIENSVGGYKAYCALDSSTDFLESNPFGKHKEFVIPKKVKL